MFINIYNILIRFLYPLAIRPYINKRKEHGKEDVKRFNERIGKPKLPRPEGRLFWLHGASVGESLSMLPLIDKLLQTYPEAHVMVTTGTTTSAELMGKRLPERAFPTFPSTTRNSPAVLSNTGAPTRFCGLNRNYGRPCFPPSKARTFR